MRDAGKSSRDGDDYEEQFLHQTIGASRIRSHSTKYGSHKVSRHHHFTSTAPSSSLPSTSASAPGAAGTSASSVSAYLENLPSLNLGGTPPPRPPRPPGGLLGISNGRGIGYGRALGSSYDSPLTIHDSFNGHVRSGANLYGGRSQSSGLVHIKPSSGHHRPSMSVFPIQKALEIAMKESRLLAAASSRGGSGSSGTGMNTGTTFVRELRRARHTRGAIITEHGPTPDISLDEEEDEETHAADADTDVYDARTSSSQGQGGNSSRSDNAMESFQSRATARFDNLGSDRSHDISMGERTGSGHVHGDIRIQRPAIASYDLKTHYPGIAYLPHNAASYSGVLSLHSPRSLRNVPSTSIWNQSSGRGSGSGPSPGSASAAALASTSISSSTSSASAAANTSSGRFSHASLGTLFMSSGSASAPYQSHYSPVLSSSSTFPSTHALFSNHSTPSSSIPDMTSRSAVHAVRELLDSYPAPSPYCVDDKKRSPLHFAAASGDLELVEFLLERGVRPDCAIISNRIDVVAALLKAGADMTLASPMTHKTPLDLAESRLSYLLSRAQETIKQSRAQSSESSNSGMLDLHDSQIATLSSFQHAPPTQSPALLYQIRGIVNLLRPYVVRQQKLQQGERQKERQKERSWERADKYMRQHQGQGGGSGQGLWRMEANSDDNFGDMEDEDEDDEEDDDHMDTGDRRRLVRSRFTVVDMDGDMELNDDEDSGFKGRPLHSTKTKRSARRPIRRMDADETEEALENLMNGLSLLEANRKQLEQQHAQTQTQGQGQNQDQQALQQLQQSYPHTHMHSHSHSQQSGVSDIADGNLADSELDPRSEQEVDEALPDLLEQVQQVLQAIKLNENQG
ncbi:hypothetical protein BGZ54_006247 [Gamsiella multidivaricata]|nr:hypothetical protein BGZ54_006247 [Gamsiella multidivaricata]